MNTKIRDILLVIESGCSDITGWLATKKSQEDIELLTEIARRIRGVVPVLYGLAFTIDGMVKMLRQGRK